MRTDVASRAQIELAAIFVLILDFKSNPEYKSTVVFQTIFYVKVMPISEIGLAETSFKVINANPKLSFHNEKYRNSTDLSKHF